MPRKKNEQCRKRVQRTQEQKMKKKKSVAIIHKLRFISHFLLNLFPLSFSYSLFSFFNSLHFFDEIVGYTQRLSCNNFTSYGDGKNMRSIENVADDFNEVVFSLSLSLSLKFNNCLFLMGTNNKSTLVEVSGSIRKNNTMTWTKFDYKLLWEIFLSW